MSSPTNVKEIDNEELKANEMNNYDNEDAKIV